MLECLKGKVLGSPTNTTVILYPSALESGHRGGPAGAGDTNNRDQLHQEARPPSIAPAHDRHALVRRARDDKRGVQLAGRALLRKGLRAQDCECGPAPSRHPAPPARKRAAGDEPASKASTPGRQRSTHERGLVYWPVAMLPSDDRPNTASARSTSWSRPLRRSFRPRGRTPTSGITPRPSRRWPSRPR